MQTYSLSTIVFAVAIIFLVSYAVQPQKDSILRVAYITNSKPDIRTTNQTNAAAQNAAEQALLAESAAEPEVVEVRGANMSEVASKLQAQQNGIASDQTGLDLASLTTDAPELASALPPEFDQYNPTVEVTGGTQIGELQFSTIIDEFELIALAPERVFEEGSYTIYATFDYQEMADGMVWSWVWRRDGQVVSGGNELWVYGDEGPGYVYFNPREGFSSGEYTLEIWVNGELFNQANLFITNDIAASR